jgi:hypothetical protein
MLFSGTGFAASVSAEVSESLASEDLIALDQEASEQSHNGVLFMFSLSKYKLIS